MHFPQTSDPFAKTRWMWNVTCYGRIRFFDQRLIITKKVKNFVYFACIRLVASCRLLKNSEKGNSPSEAVLKIFLFSDCRFCLFFFLSIHELYCRELHKFDSLFIESRLFSFKFRPTNASHWWVIEQTTKMPSGSHII